MKTTKKPAIQTLGCASLLLFSMGVQAQICKDSITATTPDDRFDILAGGSEVKDKKTGLIWQRCSLGQHWNNDQKTCTGKATRHQWQAAHAKAQDLGHGYRLPNLDELASLVERQCYRPTINERIFPNTPLDSWFWSSSLYPGGGNDGWVVSFFYGFTSSNYENYYYYVRAVKEGK